ncbi:hypothetical protein ACH5RR_001083 [Cinchona calisaya]|uniref:Uncharacterized protein n=1 Tax=Cinchona calisaya TaxID=153742 RepID=A0ABD3B3K4_9GENT
MTQYPKPLKSIEDDYHSCFYKQKNPPLQELDVIYTLSDSDDVTHLIHSRFAEREVEEHEQDFEVAKNDDTRTTLHLAQVWLFIHFINEEHFGIKNPKRAESFSAMAGFDGRGKTGCFQLDKYSLKGLDVFTRHFFKSC